MAETDEGYEYAGLPSFDELGRSLNIQPQIEAPKPTGPADTWDILWYRLRQGFQNNLISNVADSLSLMGASDPDYARMQLRRQRDIDLYKSDPSAAQAVAQGRDGGFAGDVAQFVGAITDPTLLLPFGTVGTAGRVAGLGAKAAVGGTMAAIGATANLAHQYVQSPDIDFKEAAMWTALSGVLGYALTPEKAAQVSRDLATASKITPGAVGEALQGAGVEATPKEILAATDQAQAAWLGADAARTRKAVQYGREMDKALATTEQAPQGTLTLKGVQETPPPPVVEGAPVPEKAPDYGQVSAQRSKSAIAQGRQLLNDEGAANQLSKLMDDPALVDFSDRVALDERWEAVKSAYNSSPPGVKALFRQKFLTLRSQRKSGLKDSQLGEAVGSHITTAIEQYHQQATRLAQEARRADIDLAYSQREAQSASNYALDRDLHFKKMERERAQLARLAFVDNSPPLDNALQQALKEAGLTRSWETPVGKLVGKEVPPEPGVTFNSEVTEDLISRSYFKLKGDDIVKRVTLSELQKDLKGIPPEVIRESVMGMRAQGSVMVQREGEDLALHMDTPLHDWFGDRAVDNLQKQNHYNLATLSANPFFNPALLQNPRLTGAAIGGVIGFTQADDPAQGLLFGALAGGLTPWAWGKTVGKVTDIFKSANPADVGEAVGKHVQDLNMIYNPLSKIKAMGPAGRELVARMDTATDNVNFRVADVLTDYQNAIGKGVKLTERDELNIANLIEGKPTTGDLPDYVKRAAESLRKSLKEIGDEAYNTGIWAERKETPHYYPRVSDEAYLSTSEGKEKFIQKLMAIKFTPKSAEATLHGLLGNKEMAKRYVRVMAKNGDQVVIDRGLAQDILNRRGKMQGARSQFLENQRTLDLGHLDTLMDEFRIREPSKILSRYLFDTFTRIEHARIFGAKDEKALDLFAQIQDDLQDVGAATMAKDAYYTQAGDAQKSEILKRYQNAPQWLKTMNGKMAAFETLKLIYSQILQPTQAFVNGTTQMSKVLSITDSFKTTLQALMKAVKSDPLYDDFISRAASGINVGLIEHLTEATSEATLFGHSQLAQKFNWINSPSGFLRATGFMKMEKFTQRWATLQGHAYLENLLDKAAKIHSGEINNQKLIDRVKEGLEEMGISWEKAQRGSLPEGVTLRDKMIGAMRFNRAVNFTDGARQLPQAWRSPNATLFRMFKTFTYRQGDFLAKSVISEAKKGNLKPLVTYFLAAAPAGLAVDQIRKFIRADDREYSKSEDLLRVLSTAGGFGFMNELLMSALSDADQFKNALMGPGPTDILRISSTADSLLKGDWKPMAKAAINTLPAAPFGGKEALIKELELDHRKKAKRSDPLSSGFDMGLNFNLDIGDF